MRILHTSDWRIGQSLPELPVERARVLRRQRVDTVARVAALATAERADAVLVAGGVFADADFDAEAARALLVEMSAYQGPWVVLPDCHDPQLTAEFDAWLADASLPANLMPVRGDQPLPLAQGRLQIVPLPNMQHGLAEAVARLQHRPADSDALLIGLGHRPSEVDFRTELAQVDYLADRPDGPLDYIALGGTADIRTISPRIRYSGSHEETPGPGLTGYCTLVEALPGAPLRVTEHETSYYTWSRLPLLLHSPEDVQLVDDALAMLANPRRHLVRLQLAGLLEAPEAEQLADILLAWKDRLFDLDVDIAALIVDPSADDRAALAVARLIADTTERLEMIRDDSTHPDRHLAAGALQKLYQRYIRPRD